MGGHQNTINGMAGRRTTGCERLPQVGPHRNGQRGVELLVMWPFKPAM